MKQFGYIDEDLLDIGNVNLYQFDAVTQNKTELNGVEHNEYGFIVPTFNDALDAMLEEVYTLRDNNDEYEKLVLGVADPTNLAGRKPMLGGGWKENEWDKNRIAIRIPKGREEHLTHKGIKMTKERIGAFDVLCGELSLA